MSVEMAIVNLRRSVGDMDSVGNVNKLYQTNTLQFHLKRYLLLLQNNLDNDRSLYTSRLRIKNMNIR